MFCFLSWWSSRLCFGRAQKKRKSSPTDGITFFFVEFAMQEEKTGFACWYPAIVRTFSITTHFTIATMSHIHSIYPSLKEQLLCGIYCSCMAMRRPLSLSLSSEANSSNLHRRYILSAFLSFLRGTTATSSHFVVNKHKYARLCAFCV